MPKNAKPFVKFSDLLQRPRAPQSENEYALKKPVHFRLHGGGAAVNFTAHVDNTKVYDDTGTRYFVEISGSDIAVLVNADTLCQYDPDFDGYVINNDPTFDWD